MRIFKKADVLVFIAAAVVCVALILFFSSTGRPGSRAVVRLNGEMYCEKPLDADCEFTVNSNGGYNIIKISNGEVTVAGADCPDLICVKHPAISRGGEIIVCLPHRLTVEIEE